MLRALTALAVLSASPAVHAEDLYAHSAAGVGQRHVGLQLGLAFGGDALLSEGYALLGLNLRVDVGLHDRVALAAWGAAGSSPTRMCIDYASGSPYPSSCFSPWAAGGGLALRFGLLRAASDRFQVGVEIGGHVRRLRESGVEDWSVGLDSALLVSAAIPVFGLVYLRGGFDWYRLDDGFRVSVRRQPYVVVGLELLPGKVHPFLEGGFGRSLWSSRDAAAPQTLEADKWSLTTGIAAAF